MKLSLFKTIMMCHLELLLESEQFISENKTQRNREKKKRNEKMNGICLMVGEMSSFYKVVDRLQRWKAWF